MNGNGFNKGPWPDPQPRWLPQPMCELPPITKPEPLVIERPWDDPEVARADIREAYRSPVYIDKAAE